MAALKEGEDIIEPLRERLVGCVALDEVTDPHELDEDERPKVLVEAGKLIDEETAPALEGAGAESVRVRPLLTCEAKRGVCRLWPRPQPAPKGKEGLRGARRSLAAAVLRRTG